jgi:hypothetical protein
MALLKQTVQIPTRFHNPLNLALIKISYSSYMRSLTLIVAHVTYCRSHFSNLRVRTCLPACYPAISFCRCIPLCSEFIRFLVRYLRPSVSPCVRPLLVVLLRSFFSVRYSRLSSLSFLFRHLLSSSMRHVTCVQFSFVLAL